MLARGLRVGAWIDGRSRPTRHGWEDRTMARYLAVRTGAPEARETCFYVVDTASGLAVTTHGSWSDAQATARLGNEEPTAHREAYCRQCETTLQVDALTAECGVCGSRYIGIAGGGK